MLLFVHHVWSTIQIDIPSTILVVVAILPWLAPVIKSVELPGGFKIELADAKHVTEKVISAFPPLKPVAPCRPAAPQSSGSKGIAFMPATESTAKVSARDQIFSFQQDVERRLKTLAIMAKIEVMNGESIFRLLPLLEQKLILPSELGNALAELIALINQTKHGVQISPEASRWLTDMAPGILYRLDAMIDEAREASE